MIERRSARRSPWLAYVPIALALAGCDDDKRRPYTPFQLPSAGPTSAAPSASSPPLPVKPTFAARKSILAPKKARVWELEGRSIKAPKAHYFERALVADFRGGDGEPQIAAWIVPSKSGLGVAPGQLWLYQGGDKPKQLAEFPTFLPTGPGCKPSVELLHTGARSLTVDIRVECDSSLVPRAPVRAISVLSPTLAKPHVLTLRLADAAPGESLIANVDSTDHDDDGRDDVTLSITVQAKGTDKEASALFRWFDRSAGTSRDTSEPQKSFTDIGSVEVVRARGKTTSQRVPERINNARRLFSSVCEDSGVPRVFDEAGQALSCGDLNQAFTWYLTAEVNSALTRKEPAAAISALARAAWWPAKIPAATQKELREKALRAVNVKRPSVARTPSARPRAAGSLIRYSPLAFERDGSLLVQTVDGIIRITDTEELDVSEEVDAWPLTVIGNKGRRLIGVQPSCDRSEIVLSTTDSRGTHPELIPTPILSPRPGACKGGVPIELPTSPIAWQGETPELFVAGVRTTQPAHTAPQGSARAGSYEVAKTSLGLLVFGGSRLQLWQSSDAVDVDELSDCTIAYTGQRVACLRGGKILVLESE